MTRSFALGLTLGAALTAAAAAAPGQAPTPYAAVHDPRFISPAEATFLHDEDRVIGIAVGTMVKAYPAAILSQHGLVEDRSPSGPIAVTW